MARLSKYEDRSTLMFRYVAVMSLALSVWWATTSAHAEPANLAVWQQEFAKTDFTRTAVPLDEIQDDGNLRDTISTINSPRFQSVSELTAMGPL